MEGETGEVVREGWLESGDMGEISEWGEMGMKVERGGEMV